MNPIDYGSAFADLPAPSQAFMQGLQSGAGLNQVLLQQQQQQQAQAQSQQQAQVIQRLISDPTAGADQYAAAIQLVPGMHEQLKQAWDIKNQAQQQAQLSDLSQWAAAIQNGQPKIAVDAMNARADAMENAAGALAHTAAVPTRESQALRAQAQAIDAHPEFGNFMIKAMLMAHPDGGRVVDAIAKFGTEQRAQDQAPADLAAKNAKASGDQADAAQKQLGVIGQTLGSLQGKNAKPAQAITAIKSLQSRGALSPTDAQSLIDSVPTDPKALDDWFGQQRASGMKPDDQQKFATPDANAKLAAETQRHGQDIQHQQWVQEQEDSNAPGKPNEALAQRIAGYKQPPLGQFAMNKPWGQATMDRVAELNPSYDAAVYPARASAIKSFSSGKDGAAIESANTAMNHLATLKELALAQKNGNVRMFNQLANSISSAKGGAAPTNLKAAVMMVAPEVVKAVSGAGGTGEDRAHASAALAGNGTYSPDQVLGAVGTTQDLFAGRLLEKKRSYERATKMNDFEDVFLSPAARQLLKGKDAPSPSAAAGPAVGTIDSGYRFKGGDPSSPQNWVRQ